MGDLVNTLITIRPGPVLHVWRDGVEVARVPLNASQARRLMLDLLEQERSRQ